MDTRAPPACAPSCHLPGRQLNAKRTDIWARTARCWHWHAEQWYGTCMTGGKRTLIPGTNVRLLTCQACPLPSCPVHAHTLTWTAQTCTPTPVPLPSCPPPSVPSEPPPTSLSSPHPSALLNPPFSHTSSLSQSFPILPFLSRRQASFDSCSATASFRCLPSFLLSNPK